MNARKTISLFWSLSLAISAKAVGKGVSAGVWFLADNVSFDTKRKQYHGFKGKVGFTTTNLWGHIKMLRWCTWRTSASTTRRRWWMKLADIFKGSAKQGADSATVRAYSDQQVVLAYA